MAGNNRNRLSPSPGGETSDCQGVCGAALPPKAPGEALLHPLDPALQACGSIPPAPLLPSRSLIPSPVLGHLLHPVQDGLTFRPFTVIQQRSFSKQGHHHIWGSGCGRPFEGSTSAPSPPGFSPCFGWLVWIQFWRENHYGVKSESALQKSVETLREEGSPGSPTGQCFPLVLLRLAVTTLLSQPEARVEDPPGVCRAGSSRGLSPGPVDSHLLPTSSHSHLSASCCSNLFLEGSLG